MAVLLRGRRGTACPGKEKTRCREPGRPQQQRGPSGEWTAGPGAEALEADSDGIADGELDPVTRGFLRSSFDSLKADLQAIRKDLSQELHDLCSDLASIG
ncbi:hypothetical protein NDU88_006592 [Pleurodeles waltl]|uniref:Uncharacterized protein n=1 Tax=Pleurodeles waltl TaxID=8319 RepID=A0AAV7TY24_PLEWA|nr:hypothetical protein NDU88_006592 [Pleurodeles waltl]